MVRVGDLILFEYDHVLEHITFRARVVKVTDEHVFVRVPDRVRRLPFPPFQGMPHARMSIASAERALVK